MKESELIQAFKHPPERAVEYLSQKGYKITENWHDMLEDAHAKAFTVAKMAEIDLLKDTKKILEDSLKEGKGARYTQKELEKLFTKKGWMGTEITENGKTIQLGSKHRIKTIYKSNIQAAYNAGRHLEQLENVDIAPYFQYVALIDGRERAEHRALNGKIFRYDDPFWNSFYPPNGYNCRCTVRSLSERFIKRNDLKIETSKENDVQSEKISVGNKEIEISKYKFKAEGRKITFKTDAGWNSNPAKCAWGIDVQAYSKIEGLPQKIKDDFISKMAQNPHRENTFKNLIDKVVKSGFKTTGLEKTVTWLTPEILSILNKDKIDLKNPVVVFQDNRIPHIIGDRAKLGAAQLKEVYEILNNPDNIYYDYTKRGTVGLVYTKNIPNTDDCMKICVKLSRKHKKTKEPVNYISTAGIVKKKNMTNTKDYKKIK